jgi:2-oxoglutarate ferredoxin oxidoreductase subunit alpha
LLVLSWGGTYGAIRSAVMKVQQGDKTVSHAHLRYLNPFPYNLGQITGNFERILVPELNFGQLLFLLRARYPEGNYIPYSKVQGQPFKISEIIQAIKSLLS